MTTKRTPINRSPKGRITPVAVEAYRRLRSWDGRCTCPPRPPYPGRIFDSSNPEHREQARRHSEACAVYEKRCAACPACPAQALEESFLLRELQVRFKPWQIGLKDFPDLISALEAALEERGGASSP
jgi:hypothetical protein